MAVSDQPPASGPPEGRRPYWPVATGLLAFVVVLVVASFLLNRHFRSSVGVAAAPSISAPAISVTQSGSTAASPAATAASSSVSASPAASSGAWPAPSGTVTPLGQEVATAYQHYWLVYSDALLQLDTSKVPEVATGDELQRIQAEVDGLRKRNDALRTVIEHHYFVFDVTAAEAKVYDEIHDGSYTVDPVTKQPPQGPDQRDIYKDIYFFQKTDAGWKVRRSVRQQNSGQ